MSDVAGLLLTLPPEPSFCRACGSTGLCGVNPEHLILDESNIHDLS